MRRPLPVARLLPPEAVAALQQAAATPLVPNAKEPKLSRWAAVQRATARIKAQYPHLFKESHHES